MAKLIGTFTVVCAYAENCADEYSAILSRANDTLTRVEKMYNDVQTDAERLSQQIMRGMRMLDEIRFKVDKYHSLVEDAAVELDRCDAQIDYVLSHPVTQTYTDGEGNSYTVSEVDEAALSAAYRARDQALATYEHYREKYEQANNVMYEVGATVNRFEQIKHGVDAVAQSMQSDIFEIKKYVSAIENESEYNLAALQGAINSMGAYLSSKPIYMPAGKVLSGKTFAK